MTSGNFDPSLAKYKPQKQKSISVTELFSRFTEHKKRTISIGGSAKYIGLQKHFDYAQWNHVETFFGNKNVIAVTETVSENFRDYLAQKLEPLTLPPRSGMGFLRDFALNIPERQLLVLWVLAHTPFAL